MNLSFVLQAKQMFFVCNAKSNQQFISNLVFNKTPNQNKNQTYSKLK